MTVHKDKEDQARSEMLKIIRTAVRLKYSLLADRELNKVLPEADKKFRAMTKRNVLPDPEDIKREFGM